MAYCTCFILASNICKWLITNHADCLIRWVRLTKRNRRTTLVNEVIHLGHNLSKDIFKFNASKCVADFNHQCNMYFANFKYANSNIRNVFFHKYCTAFYGSQVLPMFNSCMEEIYIAWRVAIRRVWRVPWTTHCKLLPHLANSMDIELWFLRRCMWFIKMAINSSNIVVKTITNMDIWFTFSNGS